MAASRAAMDERETKQHHTTGGGDKLEPDARSGVVHGHADHTQTSKYSGPSSRSIITFHGLLRFFLLLIFKIFQDVQSLNRKDRDGPERGE